MPEVPSLNINAGDIIGPIVSFLFWAGLWIIAGATLFLMLAIWRGWFADWPYIGKLTKKFHRKLTVIRQDGNNLKMVTDWGRDFFKKEERLLEIKSDGTIIPGGRRGDILLYSPKPGMYGYATLEHAEPDKIKIWTDYDDDAARLIFVTKMAEIRQRFNIKSWFEKIMPYAFGLAVLFVMCLLIWQTWASIASSIGTMTSISEQQAQTASQQSNASMYLTYIMNRSYGYVPPIPGGK
jgi:hypothetical protein